MRAYRVRVDATDEDLTTAALWEAGTAGIEVRAEPGGRVVLLAYFEGTAVPTALPPGAAVEPIDVPDVDWVARFREGFRAFSAGGFRIVPAWEPAAGDDRRTLRVDPGRAFGTGTHETTRLCLGALERLASRRRLGRTLDLGAGTGLLAVAAARLGASPVVASDLDPEASASSRAHAALNGAPLLVVRADGARGLRPGSFDLVLANLMALLLVDRAEEILSLLAPGGGLVLSGILEADAGAVEEAFSARGRPTRLVEGEWTALVYEGEPA
jgi:ribosomal protein L11 methyltransferase